MKQFLKLLFAIALVSFSIPLLASGDPVIIATAAIGDLVLISGLTVKYVNSGILAMNSIDQRMIFDNARQTIIQAYGAAAVKKFVLTNSTLRLEQALVAGQTLYTFPVLTFDTQVAAPFNTEIRLKQQDTFIVSHMADYLALPTSATDTAFIPLTYESPFLTGANAIPMRALWSGDIKITIANYTYVYNWDLLRHYYAPITQQTAALGAGSPKDQVRWAEDAFWPVEPTVALLGTEDNLVQVNLDAAPASFNASARIGLLFRGVNAQNSTPVAR
jgi:hypothetical protein